MTSFSYVVIPKYDMTGAGVYAECAEWHPEYVSQSTRRDEPEPPPTTF